MNSFKILTVYETDVHTSHDFIHNFKSKQTHIFLLHIETIRIHTRLDNHNKQSGFCKDAKALRGRNTAPSQSRVGNDARSASLSLPADLTSPQSERNVKIRNIMLAAKYKHFTGLCSPIWLFGLIMYPTPGFPLRR